MPRGSRDGKWPWTLVVRDFWLKCHLVRKSRPVDPIPVTILSPYFAQNPLSEESPSALVWDASTIRLRVHTGSLIAAAHETEPNSDGAEFKAEGASPIR